MFDRILTMKQQILDNLKITIDKLHKISHLDLYDSLRLNHIIDTLRLTRKVVIENENIQLDSVDNFLEGFEEEINYFLS